MVASVGQIGCIPYQLARLNGNDTQCNEKINQAIVIFNTGLRKLVDSFNKGQLPGAKFVYLDSFQSSKDLVRNAATYGNIFTLPINLFLIHFVCVVWERKVTQRTMKKYVWFLPLKHTENIKIYYQRRKSNSHILSKKEK